MLSVISIGISNYSFCELGNITCAGRDSEKVYDAFKDIMEQEFAEHTSICLRDTFAGGFRQLLDNLRFSFTDDKDTIVLYFSGHAYNVQTYGGNLDFSLCFSDFNEKLMCGYVSLANTIIPTLNKICCNIVLILDCCYSGEALKHATSFVGNQQISVLTATGQRELASFSEKGSLLANAVISGIKQIKVANQDFTLNTLQEHIQAIYSKARINLAASDNGDIILKNNINIQERYFDLEKRFLRQIRLEDDKYKEAIWYSMCDLPIATFSKIMSEYFHAENDNSTFPVEVNWLVRRSIGSSIACIEDISYRRKLTMKLMKSPIWQEQCIGIIGARYDIQLDNLICQECVQLVADKTIDKIDAVWLVNLYAADNDTYDYQIFLSTSLAKNIWGLNEIYNSAIKHGCSLEEFSESLKRYKVDASDWMTQIAMSVENLESKLHKILCEKDERGRLPVNSGVKFLLSSLYGNWRRYKSINLGVFFRSHSEAEIRKELQQVSNYAEIENKMAVYEYFLTEQELLVKYVDSLKWGLNDAHPWVRRTAIQAFKAAGILREECNQSITNYILSECQHIGELDLIIEYDKRVSDADELIRIMRESQRYSEYDIEGVNLEFSKGNIDVV